MYFLLKACISISETYIDSNTSSDDKKFEISGYTFVCSDKTSYNEKGCFCVYYKSFLPLRTLNIQYLQESICFEF